MCRVGLVVVLAVVASAVGCAKGPAELLEPTSDRIEDLVSATAAEFLPSGYRVRTDRIVSVCTPGGGVAARVQARVRAAARPDFEVGDVADFWLQEFPEMVGRIELYPAEDVSGVSARLQVGGSVGLTVSHVSNRVSVTGVSGCFSR